MIKKADTEPQPQILIVDDDSSAIDALCRLLKRAGYTKVTSTTDSREAMQLCLWHAPDLVLLDLHMPFLRGEQVLTRLRQELPTDTFVPVIVLTGDGTAEAKRSSFTAGAQDFIAKPFEEQEVLLRIHNQLESTRLHRDLQNQNKSLEMVVRERTQALEYAQLELLERLAHAAEYRDDDTGEHTRRVGRLAARIAGELGMEAQTIELIWRAAMLHDLGKIGIPDGILLKPGKLTDEEMTTMRTHVSIGADILAGGTSPYLQVAERIARTHHEWWNGKGYLGMSGEEIPIEGRIVAVADVYDALVHERPYKAAWPTAKAVEHIKNSSGSQFDPAVVDAFLLVLSGPNLDFPPDRKRATLRVTGRRSA